MSKATKFIFPMQLVRWMVGLLLLIGLLAWGYNNNRLTVAPQFADPLECARLSETIAPTLPWRFRPDPTDIGLAEGWFSAEFDDSAWGQNAPGIPWEEHGYADYDGVGWYRATFQPLATWQQAYLGTVQVDDIAQLWINGKATPFDTIVELPVNQPVQISYRIEDFGSYGGIKQAVHIGRNPQSVLSSNDYGRYLATANPDWPLPGWTNDTYHAWTFSGAPAAANEALITSKAAVAPWANAPLLEWWLLTDTGELLTPDPTFSLRNRFLPIPQAQWTLAGLNFNTTFFAEFAQGGVHFQLNAQNQSAEQITGTLLAVLRPLAVSNDLRLIYNAGFNQKGELWINGEQFLASSERPEQFGVATLPDMMDTLLAGNVPATRYLDCVPDGMTAAVLAFPLDLAPDAEKKVTLTFSAEPAAQIPNPRQSKRALAKTTQAWQTELGSPDIEISDTFVMDAYQASLGYLLIALDPDGPHPGPLSHDALWVRDAVYIGETLISLGRADIVNDYFPSLIAYQRSDGYVPAVIGADGPWDKEEWDAQGQLIFLIAELYRYDRDKAQLAERYQAARLAAEFLVTLRQRTANDPPTSRGILPPSESAEDLGPGDEHHYWDNFWAVIGLENGAFLAAELGYADDAVWMQAEADDLRIALRASITAVMGADAAYIPNGPADTVSSAMARGSANALYPEEVFSRDDPLIVRSFDTYYQRWIEPQEGGFQHLNGHWWPYGGMGLGRDYIRLGRQDILHQILGWSLKHQTLDGTFAWAEQVNPATKGFSGGDMPHAWAAASYITLIREMLLFRDGDRLEILAGVPGSWLEAGKVVAVRDAGTAFGRITLTTSSDLIIEDDQWTGTLFLSISGDARPPGGFRWRLPHPPANITGPIGTRLVDGWLLIPATGGDIKLTFQ